MKEKYAAFCDFLPDCAVKVFDSYGEAEEWYKKLSTENGSQSIGVYIAKVVKETKIGDNH